MNHAIRTSWIITFILLVVAIVLSFVLKQPAEDQPISHEQSPDSTELVIVMYHHILPEGSSNLGPYITTPGNVRNDILELQNRGYSSVNIQDLISYVNGKLDLPKKTFMITFDDGCLSFQEYILPILEETQTKAVVSIVGAYAQTAQETDDKNPRYAYMDYDDIKALNTHPLVEFQNHSYNLHNQDSRLGSMKKSGESLDQYNKILTEDLRKCSDELRKRSGVYTTCYTYPFGQISDDSIAIVKAMGFQASMSCQEGINTILKDDPDCLYLLKRTNRPHGIRSQDFVDQILSSQK